MAPVTPSRDCINVCRVCCVMKLQSNFYLSRSGRPILGQCKRCHNSTHAARRAMRRGLYRRVYDTEGQRAKTLDAYVYKMKHHRAVLAHKAVARAVKKGRLAVAPCEVCGSEKSRAHHDDYANQLDVRWLCSFHHTAWHRVHGPARNAA